MQPGNRRTDNKRNGKVRNLMTEAGETEYPFTLFRRRRGCNVPVQRNTEKKCRSNATAAKQNKNERTIQCHSGRASAMRTLYCRTAQHGRAAPDDAFDTRGRKMRRKKRKIIGKRIRTTLPRGVID